MVSEFASSRVLRVKKKKKEKVDGLNKWFAG